MKKELNARYCLLLLIMFVCNSLRANDVVFVAGTDVSQTLSITKDGITITLSSGTLSRTDNYRPYAGSTTTISSEVGNITKVVFTCTTQGNNDYSPNSFDKSKVSSGTYSYSGYDGIWKGNAESFSIGAKSLVRITKIVVTYTPMGTTEPVIIFNGEDSYEIEMGSDFNEPNFSIASEGVSLSYQSDNIAVASVGSSSGEISINGVGTATITARFAGNATYSRWTKSYTITVKSPPGDPYTLVTNVADLVVGDKVIIVNNEAKKAMSTTQNTNNRGTTDVTFDDGKAIVPLNSEIQVFKLVRNSEGWCFSTGNGYIYAASSSSNYLRTQTEMDDNAKAVIMISEDGIASIVFQGTNTHNTLQYNSGSSLFACYAPESSQKPVYIYKLADGKQDADLSFSEESVVINSNEASLFESPTFNNPHRLTVKMTSTNEDVAIFDVETGKIVLKGSDGTTEITVTSAATDEYRAGEASITVTVAKVVIFRKITSTDELEAGKRYIIVNESKGKVMATYDNYHYLLGDVVFTDNIISVGSDKANILTLGGEEGVWTFASSLETGYVGCTVDLNNLEPVTDATSATAQWTISFEEDGDAKIQSNYNMNSSDPDRWIMFNSDRFSSYKGTQQAVQLYVELDDVTQTISSVGYATLFYSDRALMVPEGVVAMTYTVSGGKLAENKKYESGSKIPKGEAVVLKGAAGEYTFTATTTEAEKDADNQLKGSDEAEETTGGNYYYALQAKSKDGKHGPGMYWMNSTGAAFENGAHKAYMALQEKFAEAQGLAKEFYLFDDATTGINVIDSEINGHKEMFNLYGQRVGRGYRGVVIKNGKKSLVK